MMKKLTNFENKVLRSIFFSVFLAFSCIHSYSQSPPCAFDEVMEYNLQETSDFQFLMEQAEKQMQGMMDGNPQAIMNGSVYTIPVVFHVIHLGESVGSGSNISEAQVLQALDDLNSDFRDYQMTGTDVEIEFCLAQRDPQGNSQFNGAGDNITGIQRVNGTGTANYESIGISQGNSGNEVEVKALSNWPNTDYLNIWVVYNIPGGVIGYATFPVADDSVDGIVLEASATGTSDLSHVISHEAGHFLDLYHTFQGSSSFNDCPSNNDCHVDGDMLCDTRPHSFMNQSGNWFPCDESQYMNCDNASYTYDVTENHMNYTDNDCRNEFTSDQVMRMRCALMTLRPTLMNSLGCQPGCTDVTVDFTPSATTVEEGMPTTFTNQSSNATSYLWEVNDETFSSTDLSYTFQERGFYDVCLTASNATCTNRKCIEIKVIGDNPCLSVPTECDLLINGDFNESNFPYTFDFICCPFQSDINEICNWSNKTGSPDLFNYNNVIATDIVSGFSGYQEGIVTSNPLFFEGGQTYEIFIDYVLATPSGNTITPGAELYIGLAPNADEYLDYSIDILIGSIVAENFVDEDYFDIASGNSNITIADFATKSICYLPTSDLNMHLFFVNEGKNTTDGWVNFLVKDIRVVCKEQGCTPIPDFTYDEDCPKEFMGINTGDGDEYIWDFLCNGVTMSGQNVTIDLPVGDCEVCLTAICEQETPETICKTVTIPKEFTGCEPVCQDLKVELQTCKQDVNTETTFIADFSISVPDGTTACDGVDIVSGSNQFDASASVSIEDDPNDPTFDIVNVSITFITPPGTDILNNSIAGLINLCDPDGKVICYNLICVATECTNCLGDITATAPCVDPNPFDDEYIYEGSVTIDLPSNGFTPCDPVSTEVGYDQTISGLPDSDQAIIDFTISTNTEGDFDASSLLCFKLGDIQYCYTLNIDIDPCPVPPTNCVQKWASKPVNCTKGEEGTLTYNFSMGPGMIESSGYQICDFGVQGTLTDQGDNPISGGSVQVNTGIQSGNSFILDVDLTVPCDYEGRIVILRLYFCDDRGNMVCYYFPVILNKCSIDCDDKGDGGVKGRSSSSYGINQTTFLMYPNPAQHEVTLEVENATSKQHNVQIIDQLGRVVSDLTMPTNIRIDFTDLQSGIHFIKVTDDEGNLIGIEKLLILK